MQPLKLPIDEVLPELKAHLAQNNALVLEAEPGAGKTTRVPPALLDLVDGEIIVLEPRRLAARLAARRVAEERGERVGETIGYRVRFEEATSERTRLSFVTEGVFLRRILADPKLTGVDAVVLDEFHERHLQSDLALALSRRVQAARPSLRIVAMSATLEAAPIAEFLGDCKVLRVHGRRFDVAVEYKPANAPERYLDADVAAAVRGLAQGGLDGDVLVFLPGAAEIRRAAAACAELARQHDLEVLPLHGDLSPDEQDRAVNPGRRRKVILSTNVAETSITIEGVAAVVDSGLARVAAHSPWSGLPTLRVQRVSRASATQRAGRAGRTRAGRCLRLYTKHDHDTRPSHELPEVRRLDLTEPLLMLAASGVGDPTTFGWFEAPSPPSLAAGRELLEHLGAVDAQFAPTALGRRMLSFPLHPRQARLVVEAEQRGVGKEACLVAAILGEGGLSRDRGAAKVSGPADVLADLDHFADAERVRFDPDRLRGLNLDIGTTLSVNRVRKQLERLVRAKGPQLAGAAADHALGLAILAGYPDRVARRRRAGGNDLVLSSGGTAQLAPSSVVRDAELLVALDAEERGEQGRLGVVTVRSASSVEAEWLLDLHPERLADRVDFVWNAEAGRVDAVRKLVYDQITIDESRSPARADEGAEPGRVLFEAVKNRARTLVDGEALDRVLGRVAFLRGAAPELALPALPSVEEALQALCQGRTRADEITGPELFEALLQPLDPAQRRKLDELAPERVTLPGGRGVRVSYPIDQAPFIESRLQDFFGMVDGPKLVRGRVSLTLHLLAPNQRAVQVTSDLAGFWDRHYPAIRRELCRRYPRHSWPDDPRTAQPPAPRGRR